MTNMENGEVVMSGYLHKSPPESKLRNLRSWTKRYFVLHANKLLYYFKTEKDKRPVKDPIKLSSCKCVEANLNHERFKFVFSVVTHQRIYYLVADTQLEMEHWVDKLTRVCGFRRTDPINSPDGNSTPKVNAVAAPPWSITTAPKHHTLSPARTTPTSFSPPGTSLTSPTGPCPLSIPKHFVDERNKPRSVSDPPDPHPTEAPQPHRERMRRGSEQIGSAMSPSGGQMIQNKARLSGSLQENYDLVFSPRSLSVQPSQLEKRLESYTQPENNDVATPQPYDAVPNLSSPRQNSGQHLSPGDYDAVPNPRPLSQASNRSSQDVYDLVPPPRPLSSGSQDGQSLYDIPPKVLEQENYDVVPPVHRPVGLPKQSHYNVLPSGHSSTKARESVYDVLPPGRAVEHKNYDVVPPVPRPVFQNQPGPPNENCDVLPKRHPSVYEENYDIVPPVRPIAPRPNHVQQKDTQQLYDVVPRKDTPHKIDSAQSVYGTLPTERENYDIVPPVKGTVPRPPHENYDFVPSPRAIEEGSQLGSSSGTSCNGHDQRSSDIYDVPPNLQFTNFHDQRLSDIYDVPPNLQSTNVHGQHLSDIYDVPPNLQFTNVHECISTPPRPAPYQPAKDPYDTLPNTNRPVSADSGLNASFTSICSLKSDGYDGQHDSYNAPLPALPKSRDSGSLSDGSPNDDTDSKEIYDRPPNWETSDSIYDVPPKQECIYDVPPDHTDIYDTPLRRTDDMYNVPLPSHDPGESSSRPVVDRSMKPPPQVNRATKPRTPTTQDHSYCNMAPPVDRQSKYKRSSLPRIEPSYVNYGVTPPRPQNLPLVKTSSGNSFGGRLTNQLKEWPVDFTDDLDYTPMKAPTRTEMTRCYSYSKEDCLRTKTPDHDQCYEDMSTLQLRRQSCDRSNSSSSSSLADNEDVYTSMNPMEQRHRRDLQYAEVEIVEGLQHVRMPPNTQPRRENTNYTFINEESTRALLQTSHARQGLR